MVLDTPSVRNQSKAISILKREVRKSKINIMATKAMFLMMGLIIVCSPLISVVEAIHKDQFSSFPRPLTSTSINVSPSLDSTMWKFINANICLVLECRIFNLRKFHKQPYWSLNGCPATCYRKHYGTTRPWYVISKFNRLWSPNFFLQIQFYFQPILINAINKCFFIT